MASVNDDKCEERRGEIFKELHAYGENLAEMRGGIRVFKYLVPALIFAMGLWMDSKISRIEDKFDEIINRRITHSAPSTTDVQDVNEVLPDVIVEPPAFTKEDATK